MPTLLIGTRRGVFVANKKGAAWEVGAPLLRGLPIYAVAYDSRGAVPRIFAGRNDAHWGPGIHYSDDMGVTWKECERQPRFAEGSGKAVEAIWQIVPSARSEPGVLYAGVTPAALFKSTDGGVTWSEVEALSQHPTRPEWAPGNGGLCLHSILVDELDPKHLVVGISSVGIFESFDGGGAWELCNQGLPCVFSPEAQENKIGSCIHKIAFAAPAPGAAQRIYQQNHVGAFVREGNGPWVSIQNGLPSTFGFPLAVHTQDRDCAYTIPLDGDGMRAPKNGEPAVYRTRDGGKSWQRFAKGLPSGDFNGILRDAFALDASAPSSLYFGNNGGRVFASSDNAESWETVTGNLPPVYSVRVAGA